MKGMSYRKALDAAAYIDMNEGSFVQDGSFLPALNPSRRVRPSAWIRKNEYKKRMNRRFHSMHHCKNGMDKGGIRMNNAIYAGGWQGDGPVNRHQNVYVSKRGDIRIYHGKIFASKNVFSVAPARGYGYEIDRANRRIRHMRISEDCSMCYSYLKKVSSVREEVV